MHTINFTVEDELYDPFKKAVEDNGMKMSGAFKIFMKSYPLGNTFHVEPKRPVGRPPIKEKEQVPTKSVEWYDQDHMNKPLAEYKMYPEPHAAADPRACLQWDTMGQVTGKTFYDLANDQYMLVREKTTTRMWEVGGGLQEFLSCCAMKFFAQNRMENYRFEPAVLEEGLHQLKDNWQGIVDIGYREGYIKDA